MWRVFHNLFGHGQVTREDLTQLRREVESRVRQHEAETINLHDQVRRWMRRAVAAERRLESGPIPVAVEGAGGGTPRRRSLWGARGRIAAAAAAAKNGSPTHSSMDATAAAPTEEG